MTDKAKHILTASAIDNISHEIRTPMNGLLGYLNLLQRTPLSDEQTEYVGQAKASSEALLYLLSDILDFSKIEAGKLVIENIRFNLRSTIDDILSAASIKAKEKNLDIHLMIKSSVPEMLIGDPSRIRQVINNLMNNSLKFTNKGELNLIVDSKERRDDEVVLSFEMNDTGIGISPEQIHEIFTPFSRTQPNHMEKSGGARLGLAISSELVKLMGGELAVVSELDRGTTFSFSIQLKVDLETELNDQVQYFSGLNVLLVDSHQSDRDVLANYLEIAGCKIFQADGYDKAISIILANDETNNKIDVAIIDFNLSMKSLNFLGGQSEATVGVELVGSVEYKTSFPNINGYQMAETIRKMPAGHDIKLILLAATLEKGDATIAQNYGFLGYLSKPVGREELLNCISIVLAIEENPVEQTPMVTRHSVKEEKNRLKPRILLVEDNELNRKMVTKFLQHYQMNCDVALDGSEAIKAVSEKNYDIILMDCQMPVMDGYESTRRIREMEGEYRHTPIIAITANVMSGDRQKCIDAGMDDYICKPLNFDVLLENIRKRTNENYEYIFNKLTIYMEQFTKNTGINQEDTNVMYADFVVYIRKQLEKINECLVCGDLEQVVQLAHQAKGASGNLRISPIYELALKLEVAALELNMDMSVALTREIEKFLL